MDFGIFIAFLMLLLPARIVYKIWLTPEGRLTARDKIGNFCLCVQWVMYRGSVPPRLVDLVIIHWQIIVNVFYVIMNVLSVILVKDRFKRCRYVVALASLSGVYILTRLALTFHDPVEFSITVCTELLCVSGNYENMVSLFATGFIWSAAGAVKRDIFILIPNLIGCLFGLFLLVVEAL